MTPRFSIASTIVDELAPDAGVSFQERVQPRRQRAAHDLGGEVVRQVIGIVVVADADRMREEEVALQLLEIVRRDRLVLELAEAGRDAVLGRGTSRPPATAP